MPTVLIADDDLDLLPILSEALTEEGWTVLSAASGVSALAVARSSPIDVVLADVVMEDMGGPALEAAFKLDRALEDIPFIFMSAAMAELRELPSALVLRKPFGIEEAAAVLKNCLREHGGGSLSMADHHHSL